MRIISGIHKGRGIAAPKNLPVRPTTDRAKEGLFNILQHQWEWNTIRVLDLFAGTGNMSYEFASRGVTAITAIDANRFCTGFIKKTAHHLQLPIEVIQADVLKFIEKPQNPYHIIFADPPYDFPLEKYKGMVNTLVNNGGLAKKGLLVVEHQTGLKMDLFRNFVSSRTYGSNTFSFFQKLQ